MPHVVFELHRTVIGKDVFCIMSGYDPCVCGQSLGRVGAP